MSEIILKTLRSTTSPPSVREAQLPPQSCDEPAPVAEQDIVTEGESPATEAIVIDQLKARTSKYLFHNDFPNSGPKEH